MKTLTTALRWVNSGVGPQRIPGDEITANFLEFFALHLETHSSQSLTIFPPHLSDCGAHLRAPSKVSSHGTSVSQCLEVSWRDRRRTGGRRPDSRCLETNCVTFSAPVMEAREDLQWRRETPGIWAIGEPPARRGTHREHERQWESEVRHAEECTMGRVGFAAPKAKAGWEDPHPASVRELYPVCVRDPSLEISDTGPSRGPRYWPQC